MLRLSTRGRSAADLLTAHKSSAAHGVQRQLNIDHFSDAWSGDCLCLVCQTFTSPNIGERNSRHAQPQPVLTCQTPSALWRVSPKRS